jgi:hypothetical protein
VSISEEILRLLEGDLIDIKSRQRLNPSNRLSNVSDVKQSFQVIKETPQVFIWKADNIVGVLELAQVTDPGGLLLSIILGRNLEPSDWWGGNDDDIIYPRDEFLDIFKSSDVECGFIYRDEFGDKEEAKRRVFKPTVRKITMSRSHDFLYTDSSWKKVK